jgi:hypothetical protein
LANYVIEFKAGRIRKRDSQKRVTRTGVQVEVGCAPKYAGGRRPRRKDGGQRDIVLGRSRRRLTDLTLFIGENNCDV